MPGFSTEEEIHPRAFWGMWREKNQLNVWLLLYLIYPKSQKRKVVFSKWNVDFLASPHWIKIYAVWRSSRKKKNFDFLGWLTRNGRDRRNDLNFCGQFWMWPRGFFFHWLWNCRFGAQECILIWKFISQSNLFHFTISWIMFLQFSSPGNYHERNCARIFHQVLSPTLDSPQLFFLCRKKRCMLTKNLIIAECKNVRGAICLHCEKGLPPRRDFWGVHSGWTQRKQ